MAQKQFHINTEPHEATIGNTVLMFQPEVVGAEFASAYSKLVEVQREAQGVKEEDAMASGVVLKIEGAMREFLGRFLLPESVEAFKSLRLPNRILVQLIEWVAELYGGGSGKPRAKGAAGGRSTG